MRVVEIFVCVWLGAAVVTKATAKDPLEDATATSRSHFHVFGNVPAVVLTTPAAASPISPTTYRPRLSSARISPRPILSHHGSPQYLPLPPSPTPPTTTTLPPPDSSTSYVPFYVDKNKISQVLTPAHQSKTDVKESSDYTPSTALPHHPSSLHTPKPTFKRESNHSPGPVNRPKSHFWLRPSHPPTPVYTLKPVHTPGSTYRPAPVYTPETVYKLVPSYQPTPVYTPTPRPILKPRPTHKPSSSVEHGRYDTTYPGGIANYAYSYEVSDTHQGTNFGHAENRQAQRTEGQYYVDLPDSRRMVVTYYADETGYHPTVTFEGEAKYPSQTSNTLRPQDPRPPFKGRAVYVQKPLYVQDPPTVYRSVPPTAAASQLLKATLFRSNE